jgi:hypothetical protein
MTKYLNYIFEAICNAFLFLVVIGIVYGCGQAIWEGVLMRIIK